MNNNQIRQRIIECCNIKGISQKELLKTANLNEQFLQDMKKRKSISVECISKIADTLNVSIDYLAGRTNIKEINNN